MRSTVNLQEMCKCNLCIYYSNSPNTEPCFSCKYGNLKIKNETVGSNFITNKKINNNNMIEDHLNQLEFELAETKKELDKTTRLLHQAIREFKDYYYRRNKKQEREKISYSTGWSERYIRTP